MTTAHHQPAPRTARTNPFRSRLHRSLGGQYRAPQVSDLNQESIHAEEAAVAFERERWRAIEVNRLGEPANPF
ncbi:hypothetical protein NG895_05320 [Aeoliella sp. ICT_H6.2]|uniref:Uncharacterized protein n=1 Tax=Aeoliella straminimaris TaxID=2954799 RepID=A0A9X2F6V0_9BACT|nr:hypothetical protein [Aeoliella straminimaris]MCO6043320.1 hypothetical protein [Aeoliella straminimaris]